jgi:beta-galactosidase
VDLTVSPAPADGQAYTLTMAGLKDRSPAGNPLNGSSQPFTTAAPAFQMSLDAAGNTVVEGAGEGGDASPVQMLEAPQAVDAPGGKALSFNGTTDGVVVQSSDAMSPTSAITVAAWINPADWGDNVPIVQKGRGGSQYGLYAQEGHLVFTLGGLGRVEAPLPGAGAWHHVAGTYDGQAIRLYVDGSLAGTTEAAGALGTGTDSLNIGTRGFRGQPGNRGGAGGRTPVGFHGEISSIRVYNQALLPEHIRTLATANAGR